MGIELLGFAGGQTRLPPRLFSFLLGVTIRANRSLVPERRIMHTLIKLPYAYDALEPHVDAKTVEIHHTKHHQSYVDKLNAALEGQENLRGFSSLDLVKSLEVVPESIRTVVRNNAGGDACHSMFFTGIGPNKGGVPHGQLAEAINSTFGGFDAFKTQFTAAAMSVFGSGWAWLSANAQGRLEITTTPGHDSPWMVGNTPVLVFDVWEHSYYLKHQNRRAEAVAAFWNVVDWDVAAKRFKGE